MAKCTYKLVEKFMLLVPPFSIAIQAGGKSSRMGQDKGLLPFMGLPLVLYVYEQVKALSSDIFIVSNNASYGELGHPVHADVLPGTGALGGLYSALYHARNEYCLVLACDMPFVNLDLLAYMHSCVSDHDAVIPRLMPNEYAEPFRAFYRKTCLEAIRVQLQADRLKISSFFPLVNIRYVSAEEIQPIDPGFTSFLNVNTPEDLANAQAVAAKWGRHNAE